MKKKKSNNNWMEGWTDKPFFTDAERHRNDCGVAKEGNHDQTCERPNK